MQHSPGSPPFSLNIGGPSSPATFGVDLSSTGQPFSPQSQRADHGGLSPTQAGSVYSDRLGSSPSKAPSVASSGTRIRERGDKAIAPDRQADKYVDYVCGECRKAVNHKIDGNEPFRCFECGYRIMFKKHNTNVTAVYDGR